MVVTSGARLRPYRTRLTGRLAFISIGGGVVEPAAPPLPISPRQSRPSKPEILRRSEKLPLIDALLAAHRGALGVDFDAYRNHAQRMALFTLAFLDEVSGAAVTSRYD